MKRKFKDIFKKRKKAVIITVLSIITVFSLFVISIIRSFKYSVLEFKHSGINERILSDGLKTYIKIGLQNYSKWTITIKQLSVDLYTLNGDLLAEQQSPLNKPIALVKNSTSPLALIHHIEGKALLKLLEESNLIDPNASVGNIALKIITLDLSGIEVIAKGFVKLKYVPFSIPFKTKTSF